MPLLKMGRVIASDVSGTCYRVTSGRVAEGGFGEIYQGADLDDRRDPVRDVAIKVLINPLWHGEAHFGRLLKNHGRIVELLDASQMVSGSGAARLTRYVFEWMKDGTAPSSAPVLVRSRAGYTVDSVRNGPPATARSCSASVLLPSS